MIQASELYLVSSPSPLVLTVLSIWLQLLPPPTQTQSRATPVSIWSSPKLKRNGLTVTSKGVTCRQLMWVNVQEPQNELSGRNVEVTNILFLCVIDTAPLKFELKLAFQRCCQELHPRGLIFQITGQIIKEHLQNFPENILRHLMTFTAITFPIFPVKNCLLFIFSWQVGSVSIILVILLHLYPRSKNCGCLGSYVAGFFLLL